MKKYLSLSVAVILGALTLTSCSEDNNDDNGKKGDIYSDVTFGNAAMDACDDLGKQLESANSVIAAASLSDAQEAYLYEVLDNLVDNVIVPTYTKLADDTEDLEKTLNGLNVNTITQEKINKACDDFKSARENWERSEAFLGGAASDFDVDPTIDSWPLNRSLLLTYLPSWDSTLWSSSCSAMVSLVTWLSLRATTPIPDSLPSAVPQSWLTLSASAPC